MKYRQNNKKIRKVVLITLTIGVLFVVGLSVFARDRLVNYLSPALSLGASVNNASNNLFNKLQTKDDLIREIANLERENQELRLENKSRALLLSENKELKTKLGRTVDPERLILARVVSRPPVMPFDTFRIDAGEAQGLKRGDLIMAADNIELGKIEEVFEKFSQAVLYSSARERTPVEINGDSILVIAEGAGGGAITIQAPLSLKIKRGDLLTKPSINSAIIAQVESVEVGETDAFQTVKASLPINIFEETWVYVKKITND